MKKLLLFLLLLPSLAWGSDLGQDYARMNPYILGGGTSGAACSQSNDSALFDKAGASADNSTFACLKWILESNITIIEYVMDVQYQAGTGNIVVCLLPHSSGTDLPDGTTCITGTSKAVASASFSGSKETYIFTLDTPKNVDAGTYWACSYTTGGVARNYYYSAGSERSCYGSSSCDNASTAEMAFEVWGCQR